MSDDSSELSDAGFLLRSEGHNGAHFFREYERHLRGFLQRIVVYFNLVQGELSAPVHARLWTKCAPTGVRLSVYDVEHLRAVGRRCVFALLGAADDHLSQFHLSGASSFFLNEETAQARYDVTQPRTLAA